MRQTALALGLVVGLCSLGCNLLLHRDLLVSVCRAGIVVLLVAIITLTALRAISRVLVRHVRDQTTELAKASQEPPARPRPDASS